jgi:TonB-linked SusC/RagA family outer membrane protein
MLLAGHLTAGFGQTFAYYDKNGPGNDEGRQTAGQRKVSLENVLTAVQNKYGISILYKSSLVENKTVEANFRMTQTPDGTLQRLLTPYQLTFRKNGAVYVIVDGKDKDGAAIRKIEHRKIGDSGGGDASMGDVAQLVRLTASLPKPAAAAEVTVTGTVKDEQGGVLPGVNVLLKGTTTGTTTGANGGYSITVPDGNGTLVFSFIGFVPQEVPINGRSVVDVAMAADVKALNEVVVVGYGSVQKRELTNAVTTISSKDFVAGAFNNPLQQIEGRVPGLTIANSAAGDPNGNVSLQVRGASSLDAGNAPLIVIDGMPGGDLRTLAQQDIESISVLRDAAASAIYGSRGANGVILVQTKRGKTGRVSVTYDSFIEHDRVAARPEVLSADEFLARGIDVDQGARTDWYDELIRKNNFGQNHLLSVSGGTENTNFRISGNYRNKTAIDIATQRKEYGLRASFQQRAINNFLQLDGNLAYRFVDQEIPGLDLDEPRNNYGAFVQAIKLNPTIPVMDPTNPRRFNTLAGFDTYNPVQALRTLSSGADITYSVVDLTARLNLLKNLSTEVKLGRQGRSRDRRYYSSSQSATSVQTGRTGEAGLASAEQTTYILEWLNNYNVTLGRHDLTALAGYSYQELNDRELYAENGSFPSDAFTYNNLDAGEYQNEEGRLGMGSSQSKEKVIAFLGRVNYGFDDTYFLTASLRYEGNTKFGANNKWGAFPGASAAWRISKMPFLANINAIDDLKLRASFGVTGRSAFDRYTSMAKYQGFGRYPNDEGQWRRVYGPANNYNPNLRWERAIAYDLGLDYSLFNSKLTGSIDAFIRKNSDLISEYQVSVPPYLHELMFVNVGTSSARGVELALSWNAVNAGAFSYTTSLTGSYAKARLDSWSNDQFRSTPRYLRSLPSPGNPGEAFRTADGDELGSFYGYKYAGVDDKGNILIWKNGQEGTERINATSEGDRDRDRTYIGNGAPKYQAAWTNNIRYRNIDLTFLLQGRFKYDILNLYQMYYGLQAEPNINLLDDAFGRNGQIRSGKVITDYFLEKGDYVRLENITLGWNPKIPFVKALSSLRVYGTVRNVFTLTKYTGLDPTTVDVTGLEPGVGDLFVYPVTRTFTLGAQITF